MTYNVLNIAQSQSTATSLKRSGRALRKLPQRDVCAAVHY